MINGSLGAFGGRMKQIDIETFTKEETFNYIDEKVSNIKFSDDGFDKFYKCTKGLPSYINPFCNLLNHNVVYDEAMISEIFTTQSDQLLLCGYMYGEILKVLKKIL